MAMGLFYDVLDATDAPTDVLYEKIEPKDLEFEGTVGEVALRVLECVAAEGVAPWGGTTCRGPGATGCMMRSSDTSP